MRAAVAPWLLLCLALSGCTALGKIGQVVLDPSIQVGGPGEQPTQFALSLYASSALNANSQSLDDQATRALPPTAAPYAINLDGADPQELAGKLQAMLDHLHLEYPAMSPVAQDLVEVSANDAPVASPLGSYAAPSQQLVRPAIASAQPAYAATPIAFKVVQLRDDSLFLNSGYDALDKDLGRALGSTYIRADDYLLFPGQFKFVAFQAIDAETRFIGVFANYHDLESARWKTALRIEPRGRKVAVAVQFEASQVLMNEDS